MIASPHRHDKISRGLGPACIIFPAAVDNFLRLDARVLVERTVESASSCRGSPERNWLPAVLVGVQAGKGDRVRRRLVLNIVPIASIGRQFSQRALNHCSCCYTRWRSYSFCGPAEGSAVPRAIA